MISASSKGTPMIVRLARFNRAFHVREIDERALEQAREELREAKNDVDAQNRALTRVHAKTWALEKSQRNVASAAEAIALGIFESIGHTPGQPMSEGDLAKALETSKCALSKVG